jgi:hypothetical protein
MTDELANARALRCTACGVVVDVCAVCRAGFLLEHVIRCRREDGHAHANCVTSRTMRPSGWPRGASSAPPPASVKRSKK